MEAQGIVLTVYLHQGRQDQDAITVALRYDQHLDEDKQSIVTLKETLPRVLRPQRVTPQDFAHTNTEHAWHYQEHGSGAVIGDDL
jgi:hypothetical protein